MTDDDTPRDHITVATDPYVGVTREGDAVRVRREGASIPVEREDVLALADALRAFAAPVSEQSGAEYGDAPDFSDMDTDFPLTPSDAADEDTPEQTCPECDAETHEELGGRRCPNCGWGE